jgi:hypothetical protein
MKKFFSEKNLAGLLFILVLLTFSFAHEDSKKRSPGYNLSSTPLNGDHLPAAVADRPLPGLTGAETGNVTR